jgi:Uma2 family endonuclease
MAALQPCIDPRYGVAMNDITPPPDTAPTTQAAEGLPRFKWSLAQFERLIEHGILMERDHVELIGGELVPMAAKGSRHELLRDELQDWMVRRLPAEVRLSFELGWRPDGETFLEPDILVSTRGARAPTMPVGEVLLLIEIAKSGFEFDSGVKAKVYARLGVREYWVVDAVTLSTRVFREPGGHGYGSVADVPPAATLMPHLVPALAVSLGGLGIA